MQSTPEYRTVYEATFDATFDVHVYKMYYYVQCESSQYVPLQRACKYAAEIAALARASSRPIHRSLMKIADHNLNKSAGRSAAMGSLKYYISARNHERTPAVVAPPGVSSASDVATTPS
jgi:hypothetical protein